MQILSWLGAVVVYSDRQQNSSNNSGSFVCRHRNLTKTLLVMKLIILFLTFGFLHVNANAISQTVTLSAKNIDVEQVFKTVKKQTGYVFFYNSSLLKEAPKVSIDAVNMDIDKFLNILFKNLPLRYSIKDKTIVVSKNNLVSLSFSNASLLDILEYLKSNTSYRFFFNRDMLSNTSKVTIDVKNAPVPDVLQLVLNNQPLSYYIEGKVVVLSKKSDHQKKRKEYESFAAFIDVRGRVVNEKGEPVIVSVMVKGMSTGATTDANGYFELKNVVENATLIISGISIESFEVELNGRTNLATLTAKTKISEGDAVVVEANTGYQKIKPNESTGSLFVVDNKTLNQQTGTNILQRLNGVVPGLFFNVGKNNSNGNPQNTTGVVINGFSTINGPLDPLIVLDNFPYEGDINNINPIDIESVTILRDAGASSIWGPRAGNGVVVITTKKGRFNQKTTVEGNSTILITKRPDTYSLPQMRVSDYIDVEEYLFNQGYYNSQLTNASRPAVSPAVDVFFNRRKGTISAADSAAQIDYLKGIDSREQYNKYFNRNAITQQYSLNLSGGSKTLAWLVSGAYERNELNITGNQNDKINLRVDNIYRPFQKLQMKLGVYYTNFKSDLANGLYYSYNGMTLPGGRMVPYLQFADENGNPLAVAKDLRKGYVDTAGAGKLLDWRYFPLIDYLHDRTKTTREGIVGNVNINYQVIHGLDIDVLYQYDRQTTETEAFAEINSYRARDLINRYYQRSTGTFAIPRGGVLDMTNANMRSQNLRGQVNFRKTFNKHFVSAIAGTEVRSVATKGNSGRLYGYNPDPLYFSYVDYFSRYTNFITGSGTTIPTGGGLLSSTEFRFASLFANASYTYNDRYTVSASARRDGSNILGVKTNEKWNPLWSVGAGWQIYKESFYKLGFLPYLKLRASYGYSGNLDLRKTALPIATYANPSGANRPFPYANINTVNNPELRWEKVGQLNVGFDFAMKNRILTGMVELYYKKGTDLYGQTPYDYTTWGSATIVKNVASMSSKGFTVNLESININRGFIWRTTLMHSHTNSKTTEYFTENSISGAGIVGAGNTIVPIVGRPLYAIAAYRWGGLNAAGDPQGYLNGDLTTDYDAILLNVNSKGLASDNLIYFGAASPTHFGNLINRLEWKGFSASINIMYKLGYYFRKTGLLYMNLYSLGAGHSDFEKRWRKPGDEAHTHVPAMVYTNYPQAALRDAFYQDSEVFVLKGDHIRLQYINLAYTISGGRVKFKVPFQSLQIYTNVANLGILWRANKENLDPDYQGAYSPSKQFTAGIRLSF